MRACPSSSKANMPVYRCTEHTFTILQATRKRTHWHSTLFLVLSSKFFTLRRIQWKRVNRVNFLDTSQSLECNSAAPQFGSSVYSNSARHQRERRVRQELFYAGYSGGAPRLWLMSRAGDCMKLFCDYLKLKHLQIFTNHAWKTDVQNTDYGKLRKPSGKGMPFLNPTFRRFSAVKRQRRWLHLASMTWPVTVEMTTAWDCEVGSQGITCSNWELVTS